MWPKAGRCSKPFVASEHYAASFGMQWNRHRRTQLDSYTGLSISLDRLFASTGYKDQKDFVRRHAPEDDLVRRCLESLNASGGIMTPAAFSNVADIPAARLDGLIARIQRLLNVDGYEILTFSRSENRIELNVPKLKRQFDLD